MRKYFEKIVNIETGEETFRDYTAEEIAEMEANEIIANELTAASNAKENARASALAKLAALGLSADEIAAL
jgi:cytolysin (calcineurin-like family phosphatase)